MSDNTPVSGAIPMSDDEMPKKNTRKKNAASKSGGESDSKRDATAEKQRTPPERGNELNPYCGCDPCRCTPPCTCGLELKSREVRTVWDVEAEHLTHVTTEVWTPKTDAQKGDKAVG